MAAYSPTSAIAVGRGEAIIRRSCEKKMADKINPSTQEAVVKVAHARHANFDLNRKRRSLIWILNVIYPWDGMKGRVSIPQEAHL